MRIEPNVAAERGQCPKCKRKTQLPYQIRFSNNKVVPLCVACAKKYAKDYELKLPRGTFIGFKM